MVSVREQVWQTRGRLGPGSSISLLIQDRPLMGQALPELSWVLLGLRETLEDREMEAPASAPKFLMKTSVFIHWANILVEIDGNRGAAGVSQFSLLHTGC